LILEYAVGAGAVSIGWSGYVVDLLKGAFGIVLPKALTVSPFSGGIVNLPAVLIILAVTALLILGTSQSTMANNVIYSYRKSHLRDGYVEPENDDVVINDAS